MQHPIRLTGNNRPSRFVVGRGLSSRVKLTRAVKPKLQLQDIVALARFGVYTALGKQPGSNERSSDDEPRIVRWTHHAVSAVCHAAAAGNVVLTAGRFLTLPSCTDAGSVLLCSDYLFKVRLPVASFGVPALWQCARSTDVGPRTDGHYTNVESCVCAAPSDWRFRCRQVMPVVAVCGKLPAFLSIQSL